MLRKRLLGEEVKGVTILKRGKLVDLETIRKAPNEVLHPVQTQYTEYNI